MTLINFLLASSFDKTTIDSLTNNYESSVRQNALMREITENNNKVKVQNAEMQRLNKELNIYRKDLKLALNKSLKKRKIIKVYENHSYYHRKRPR